MSRAEALWIEIDPIPGAWIKQRARRSEIFRPGF
jgi:hypothetical protein